MDNSKADQLNTIVGAALKGMVQGGASDAQIGEFASNFRNQVAQVLGIVAAAPEPPDLLAIVSQAVEAAMGRTQSVKSPRATAQKATSTKTKARIMVTVQGKRTSVTVDPEVLNQVKAWAGGKEPCLHLVQHLVDKVPATEPNRSAWVQAQLKQMVMTPQGQAKDLTAH